jgi:hypothetical protein
MDSVKLTYRITWAKQDVNNLLDGGVIQNMQH